MPTTTNYGWTTPADTDLVKDGASAIRTLGSAIDTTVFNNASAAIAKTIVDAKGDIIAGTAADTVARLAVGADATVLTADSTTASGLKWATPTAGAFTLLSTTTLSSTSTSITSINQTYKHLFITLEDVNLATSTDTIAMTVNSASANMRNISYSNANATQSSSSSYFALTQAQAISTAQGEGAAAIWIYNYADTDSYKTMQWTGCFHDSTAGAYCVFFGHGIYSVVTAISSIQIKTGGSGTFSGGTAKIYGVN